MKRKIFGIMYLMMILFIINCKGKNDNLNNSSLNAEDKRVEKLLEQIKQRTARDLKKFGIKKLLLSENGVWYSNTDKYVFKSNGLIQIVRMGYNSGKMLWKVKNNELYIKFILSATGNKKFHLIKIKIIKPSFYTIAFLKKYKYFLDLSTFKKDNNGDPFFAVGLVNKFR